jgi:hypothetical protein
MAKDMEREQVALVDRDFSSNWHISTLGGLGLAVLAAYLIAVKVILG